MTSRPGVRRRRERRGGVRGAVARAGQLLRFAVVGASGVAVNLSVFTLVLAAWGVATDVWGGGRAAPPEGSRIAALVANGCGFVVSVLGNYWLNRRWTFRSSEPVAREMPRFVTVSVLAYGLQLAAFWIGLTLLPIGRTASQVLAIAFVTPVNFLANRLWSFERRRGAPEESESPARAA